MTATPHKIVPSRKSIIEFTSTGPTVRVGGLLLRELWDGSIWVENDIGEGMQVRPRKLEICLRRFFKQHF